MEIEICELEKYYKDIIDNNTEYVNKLEMCKICKIGKSTGRKILQSGEIPYKRSPVGRTHEYRILVMDIVRYLYKRDGKYEIRSEYIDQLRKYYEEKFKNVSDILRSKDICEITGYGREAIRKWLNRGYIPYIMIAEKFVIAKEDFIEFLLTPKYRKIQNKSEIHKKDIEIFKSIIKKQ